MNEILKPNEVLNFMYALAVGLLIVWCASIVALNDDWAEVTASIERAMPPDVTPYHPSSGTISCDCRVVP